MPTGGAGLARALFTGLAAPILRFLQTNVGYTPLAGEYPYTLMFDSVTFTGGDSQSVTEPLSQDAGFLWEASVAVVESGKTFSAKISNTGQEITFMPKAVHNELLFGTIQRPGYTSLKPYWFEPNSNVRLEVTDLSSSAHTIYCALIGRRIKRESQAFNYTTGPIAQLFQ